MSSVRYLNKYCYYRILEYPLAKDDYAYKITVYNEPIDIMVS